ncbi:MAG: hypothetical protein ACI4OT_05850 [Bacilli bacterium]
MYKINIEYGNMNINDIFIKVLNKEVNNYLKSISKKEISSSHIKTNKCKDNKK